MECPENAAATDKIQDIAAQTSLFVHQMSNPVP
jgi:hypothetical protein